MKEWPMIHEIKKKLTGGMSVSAVARHFGIDRKTVRKYRDLEKPEIRKQRRAAKTRSRKLDRFKKWIKERVEEYKEDGVINAESIYRELRDMGYDGSTRTVRRYISRLRPAKAKRIFEPFETEPGAQGMVDLGESRKVRMQDGKYRTMYAIFMVLSCSRKKYGEWYDHPVSTEMFLRFHERAFRYFGGVPGELVYDRTKLAVLKEHYGECQFNEDFSALSTFYGFSPYVCRPYDPQTKGKVESVVRYAKRGFLAGRTFRDSADVQRQWDQWVEEVADVKVHETTGKTPQELWEKERPHLKPVARGYLQIQESFEKRKVLNNGLIKVQGARYSVPCQYQGKTVQVRITEEKIHVHNLSGEHLYTHWRGKKGKTYKIAGHYHREYSVATEQYEHKVRQLYKEPALLKSLKQRFPRHYRDQLKGLIRLEREYTEEQLQYAAARALQFHSVSLGNIERILKGQEEGKTSIPPVQAHKGRPLSTGVRLRSTDYYLQAVQMRKEV